MVFDRIENIGTYLGTGEAMDAALNFLKVISEEGFGSTFIFTLPMKRPNSWKN